MKILALEFSTRQRSVAVLQAGAEKHAATGACSPGFSDRRLSEAVMTGIGGAGALELVDEVLRGARLEREQIECLAIGIGPGSYTGIRASIALAQGWQLARGVKLLGISSADCLARQAQAEGVKGCVNIVIDAQRGEFYLAQYTLGLDDCRETSPLRLATRAEVETRASAGEVLAGPDIIGWFPEGRALYPAAGTLAKMATERAHFVAGDNLEPIYLRPTEFVKAPPPRVAP